jgi:CubicO group peptidase (beta-lactamase class C family)
MTDTPAWLEAALAYVPLWLGYQMRLTEQPGLSVAITHGGEVVFETAFGHADLATGEAMTPRHRFRVASHSKSFTAAGVMKLREQGRLKLDDTAGQYVQGLHPEIAAATITQLLSHTAGIHRDGIDNNYWAGRYPFDDAAALREDLAVAPTIPANTRLKYSNHGFGLAGLVIEAVTGELYRAWIEREVVGAAGLTEVSADAPLPDGVPLASGHSGKALLGRRLVFPGNQPTHALAAATGFVSTAADLARFFAQLDPGAPVSFLTPASRRELSRPQWRDAYSPAPRSYGLGTISGEVGGWAWFGHSGGFQGYITRTANLPAQGLTLCLLTNTIDGPAEIWMEGVMHILKRFEAEGAPSPATADWTGRWWSAWGPADLVPMGDKVLMSSPGLANPMATAAELAVDGPDAAHITQAGAFDRYGEVVRRVRDAAGRVTSIDHAGTTLLPEAALAEELLGRYGGS